MLTLSPILNQPVSSPADRAVADVVSPVSQEVDLIISAIEAGGHMKHDRRAERRTKWRVQAAVRLFIDQPGHATRTIYTRDIHSRGLGFVSAERLPLGYGGVVDLPAKDGTIVSFACTVLRCRQATPGWFEGFVYFNREQTTVDRLTE